MEVRFISRNGFKIEEAKAILGPAGVTVRPVTQAIEELQTQNVNALVRDKCLRAFRLVGRPLFVEHTGLHIASLNGFPGGLTQVFWDTLEADRVAALFGSQGDNSVVAKTVVAYTDGRTIELFEGEIEGRIPQEPRGPREFQWDCIFVPDGFNETFAELGPKKNEISMRRVALDKLAAHLRGLA